MNALSLGHMASQALLGLSPWIIPVIAVAAKRSYDRPPRTLRGGRPETRADDAPAAEAEPPASPRIGADGRYPARLEARPWSD